MRMSKINLNNLDHLFTESTAGAYEGFHLKRGDFNKPKAGAHVDKAALGDILDCAKILPFAAEAFEISPDLADYVITPVEIIRSDLPNRNGVGFLYEELCRYNPHRGDLSYKTWKGMGTYVEHADNRDPSKACGMILDVALRRAPEFEGSFYRLNHLVAIDRNKRPDIASAHLNGTRKSFSMGSLCSFYTCSICNRNVNDIGGYCEHIDTRTPVAKAQSLKSWGGKLAYCQSRGISGLEISSVAVPAATFATSKEPIWRPNERNRGE
jgi:hypothetical protein